MAKLDLALPDQIQGAPHPRDTQTLFGQHQAEAAFLDAFNADRVHHAWLLTGPRGVGKATLAWRIARFLLATPQPDTDQGADMFGAPPAERSSLDIALEHPIARQIAAGAAPGLKRITRTPSPTTDKLRSQIVVDDIRAIADFFQLSSTDGGRRVVIVDAADNMNVQAANALLKMLEEPPARTTLLLIAHQTARLLPTIRSRCRTLRLDVLDAEDMARAMTQAGADPAANTQALATLSGGSVGEALRLHLLQGDALYAEIVGIIDSLPRLDRARALKLAERCDQRADEETRDLVFTLIDVAISRLARAGATGATVNAAPQESTAFARLCPDAAAARKWAALHSEIGARVRHGRAVNLDPASLVLDIFFKLQEQAST